VVAPERMVEAALFSQPKGMKASEVAQATGLDIEDVKKALRKLAKEYETRETAIEIVHVAMTWSMQLKKEYSNYALQLGVSELPPSARKLAGVIAYNQPVLQSELAKLMGSNIYEDVHLLRREGLVAGKKEGQTLLLTTTKKFSEYFGIPSTKKEDIKAWFDKHAQKE
jgi:segregation and condensation protein B